MSERRILPFPHIPPGMYPNELRPDDIVTAQASLFHHPVAIAIAEAVMGYRIASKRSGREDSLQQALAICEGEYPQQYQALRGYLSDSIARVALLEPTEPALRAYRELDRLVTREYEPPTNVRLYFLFEPHSVYTRDHKEEVRRRLRDRFTTFFTRDAKNIYVREDGAQDKGKNRAFQKGLKMYGSFVKAAYYYDLYVALGRKDPPDQLFATVYPALISASSVNPHFEYFKIVYELLDEFKGDRYEVTSIMEAANITTSVPPVTKDAESVSQLQQDIATQIKRDQAREKADAKQLNELVFEISQNKHTNIFWGRGPNHKGLLDILPKRLIPVSQNEVIEVFRGITLDEFELNRKYIDVYSRLRNEQPVSELDYQELFAALQRSQRIAGTRLGGSAISRAVSF